MIAGNGEYLLELSGVFHSGQVEAGTCIQKTIGTVRTGVILKDVTMELRSGELSAVLGSKGSGKRALLEVISRRAQGPTRGQILLNGVPMSLRLFQESCGYVTQKCNLLPGLSVKQTLHYASKLTIGSQVSSYIKESRVIQVMADMALTQIANRSVTLLSSSELRRLSIGVQLVRDPVLLLLDEPTWDLEPLETYFIISILANHAKKYNRIVLITMEKPRSDIFPFLDRVTYLCLGDIIFTGATKIMLDYFRSIGFPCPELENPLMYYLCLSTVDRRSRDKFIESNNQIASLVEKFRLEGAAFSKFISPDQSGISANRYAAIEAQKIPLTAYGKPSTLSVLITLVNRSWHRMSPFSLDGFKVFCLRLFLMPAFFLLMWIFYFNAFQDGQNFQRTFTTKNGLVFNVLSGAYFIGVLVCGLTEVPERTRYYQEARDGIYNGPIYLIATLFSRLPLSAFSSALSALIIFRGLKKEIICHEDSCFVDELEGNVWVEYSWYPDFLLYWLCLWACYLFAEQQTSALLVVVKSSYRVVTLSLVLSMVPLVLSSCTVKSLSGLPQMLYKLTYITQARYTGALINGLEFYNRSSLNNLHWFDENTGQSVPCVGSSFGIGCRYLNGTHYLLEKYVPYGTEANNLHLTMVPWFNLCVSFIFAFGIFLINLFLYLIPLPTFIKAKFRE